MHPGGRLSDTQQYGHPQCASVTWRQRFAILVIGRLYQPGHVARLEQLLDAAVDRIHLRGQCGWDRERHTELQCCGESAAA